MIQAQNLLTNARKSELGGYKTYKAGTGKMTDKMQRKIKDSTISLDEFIAMEQFASYLPRGKRKLKLNMPELRNELLSKSGVNQMTDVSGLRSGGLAARTGNLKAPPKKATQELDQRTILYTIKNNNRLKGNPNPTSFKNVLSV